jgi:hypothetical protein
MGVIPPAAGGFAVPYPYQVDLVPHTRIGQEMVQVRPLAGSLGKAHRQHQVAAGQAGEYHRQRSIVIPP